LLAGPTNQKEIALTEFEIHNTIIPLMLRTLLDNGNSLTGAMGIGENSRKDRGLLRRKLGTVAAGKRKSICFRLLASIFVISGAYGLLTEYQVSRSVLEEQPLVFVNYVPPGDGQGKVSGQEQSLVRSEEANGSLRGSVIVPKQEQAGRVLGSEEVHGSLREAKNEAPQPEQERGLSSEVIRVPLQGDESEQAGATKRETLCFISSIFGENVKDADQPQNVRNVFPNATSPVEFFLFTNLKDLPTPGWTKVVNTDLPYKRFITQSRWAKFMGWREEALSHCGTIIYFDGYLLPRKDKLDAFLKLAADVHESKSGLATILHKRFIGQSMTSIFKYIVSNKKELPANVNATMQWLREQPDFKEKIPYYLNKYFAYDPLNPQYREVSTFFWDRYSLELDSWRDQPLWSYSLHHFKSKPLAFTTKGLLVAGGDMFVQNKKAMGFGGHTYNEQTNSDAEAAANVTLPTTSTE
jgi:hypothetical protein